MNTCTTSKVVQDFVRIPPRIPPHPLCINIPMHIDILTPHSSYCDRTLSFSSPYLTRPYPQRDSASLAGRFAGADAKARARAISCRRNPSIDALNIAPSDAS